MRKACGRIVFLRGLFVIGMRWHFGVGNSAHMDSAPAHETRFLFFFLSCSSLSNVIQQRDKIAERKGVYHQFLMMAACAMMASPWPPPFFGTNAWHIIPCCCPPCVPGTMSYAQEAPKGRHIQVTRFFFPFIFSISALYSTHII